MFFEEYLSYPYEIEYKLKLIDNYLKSNREIPIKQVNSILKKYVNYTYNEFYHKITNILNSKHNSIIKELSLINISSSDLNNLKNNFTQIFDLIYQNQIKNLPQFNEDPFDLNTYIKDL